MSSLLTKRTLDNTGPPTVRCAYSKGIRCSTGPAPVVCGQVNILLEVNHRPLARYIEEDAVQRDHDKEYREQQAREQEFKVKTVEYLDKLTKIDSVDDLLDIVRDAAGWALKAARADMQREADRAAARAARG